jgi:hypothetical protein
LRPSHSVAFSSGMIPEKWEPATNAKRLRGDHAQTKR